MAVKRVAIVGAGSAGLPAIKCCLDEGLEPVCFEKTSDIGGVWNYRETIEEDVSCVNLTTIANTGKETTPYSDFRMPDNFPNFPPHQLFQEYLNLYAKNFNLWKYIQFNTSVEWIEKADDFESSGKWRVKRKEKGGSSVTEIFDAVMMCSGRHTKPRMAELEGSEKFKGKVMHTYHYREGAWNYAGQRVVVIGVGDSALDAATGIGEFASQVFICARRGGQWTLSRTFKNGLPWDMVLANRYNGYCWKWFPRYMQWKIEKAINERFDHGLYGMKPNFRFSNQHPGIVDTLPLRLITGSVKIKPNISRLTETGVHFVDGSFEDNIDTIIHGTGYIYDFPYLDESVAKIKDNFIELYRYVFPPDLTHPTLAAIGFVQPNVSSCGIAEMQSRWATRVFKGEVKLPSGEAMRKEMKATADAMANQYYASPRHTIQVDYIPYMDSIAKDVGCMPQIGKALLTDPILAYHMIFGPILPAQYRLHGYGTWDEAKYTIKTYWQRVKRPLEPNKDMSCCDSQTLFIGIIVLSVLFVLLYNLFL